IVVAETAAVAADGVAAVALDLDPLPATSDVERALAPDATALWPEAPGNVAFDWTDGDAAAVEAAFHRAAHVARVRLADTRLAPSALEPRAAIGEGGASGERHTLTATTPGVARGRRVLAGRAVKI